VGYATDGQQSVLALLSHAERFQPQDPEPVLDVDTAQRLREMIYTPEGGSGDTASVTASTSASLLSETSVPTMSTQPRRTSSTDLDVFSSAEAVPAATTDSTTHQIHSTQPKNTNLPHTIEALLVWKNKKITRKIPDVKCAVDFRPIAMTLGRVTMIQRSDGDTTSKAISRPVVWMGSADTPGLFAFYFNQETLLLESLTLDNNNLFAFSSSVMAIDVRNNDHDDSSSLVLACQDGTIRHVEVTSYDMTISKWCGKRVSEIVVDGPLICAHILPDRKGVLVGSLCGYVMIQDREGNPTLVVDGLEHCHLEDSVLAVHGWDDYVAIGTQSGHLAIYRQNQSTFRCAGQWTLPYSIHEICHQPPHFLWVTTRNTLNCFVLQNRPRSNARLAKDRIEKLLERVSFDYWNEYPSKRPSLPVEAESRAQK
jgi:hypothetical protein